MLPRLEHAEVSGRNVVLQGFGLSDPSLVVRVGKYLEVGHGAAPEITLRKFHEKRVLRFIGSNFLGGREVLKRNFLGRLVGGVDRREFRRFDGEDEHIIHAASCSENDPSRSLRPARGGSLRGLRLHQVRTPTAPRMLRPKCRKVNRGTHQELKLEVGQDPVTTALSPVAPRQLYGLSLSRSPVNGRAKQRR